MLVPPGAKSMMNRLTIWLAAANLSARLSVVPISSLNNVVGPWLGRVTGGASSAFASMRRAGGATCVPGGMRKPITSRRSEEHTSELQSLRHLVCRLLLENKHIGSHYVRARTVEFSSAVCTTGSSTTARDSTISMACVGISFFFSFFFNDTATPEIYPLAFTDVLPF